MILRFWRKCNFAGFEKKRDFTVLVEKLNLELTVLVEKHNLTALTQKRDFMVFRAIMISWFWWGKRDFTVFAGKTCFFLYSNFFSF